MLPKGRFGRSAVIGTPRTTGPMLVENLAFKLVLARCLCDFLPSTGSCSLDRKHDIPFLWNVESHGGEWREAAAIIRPFCHFYNIPGRSWGRMLRRSLRPAALCAGLWGHEQLFSVLAVLAPGACETVSALKSAFQPVMAASVHRPDAYVPQYATLNEDCWGQCDLGFYRRH